MNELLFLGTGGSMGTPVIGCDCEICSSSSHKNQRYRSSVLLRINGKTILIDAGPDFRAQALKNRISSIDGLILTHAHHDHTGGLDELRVFFMRSKQPIPCLLSHATSRDIHSRFAYIFEPKKGTTSLTPRYTQEYLTGERGEVKFLGIDISYFTYEQGGMEVNGLRFGDLAYVSDIKHYPDTIYEDLKGVKTLVVSALRKDPSPLHFSLEEAVNFSKRVGAQQTWLTHISHNLEHEKTNSSLPSGVQMAYDGLSISF